MQPYQFYKIWPSIINELQDAIADTLKQQDPTDSTHFLATLASLKSYGGFHNSHDEVIDLLIIFATNNKYRFTISNLKGLSSAFQCINKRGPIPDDAIEAFTTKLTELGFDLSIA